MSIHHLIETGTLDDLRVAIAAGAPLTEPGHCGATPLMTAIRTKDPEKVRILIAAGADPDQTDDFNHTALRVAVQYDVASAVEMLLRLGVDRGYRPKYPLKPVTYDLSQFPTSDLPAELRSAMSEDEWQRMSREANEALNRHSQNPKPEPVIRDVGSVEVLRLLLDAGEDLADADPEVRRRYIGLEGEGTLSVGVEAFTADRNPRFGRQNPEQIESPFWRDMILTGVQAYGARVRFEDQDLSRPIWCYHRFGHSLTALPDGRFIGIAGEHEDHYDPDFYIYNDVVVHDGRGGVTIYGYPRDVFPPTDFHTATRVGDAIYIIGNLGYVDERQVGVTPVYRLDLVTLAITPVTTRGRGPGWISRHRARYAGDRHVIQVQGGQRVELNEHRTTVLAEYQGLATLDLATMVWSEES